MSNFSFTALTELAAQGLITIRSHRDDPSLFICNYTPKCQYSQAWDALTAQCRGLILRDNGTDVPTLISRCLPKFKNLGEHPAESLPQEPFEVFEKLDGSCAISYWFNGEFRVATRGSFHSAQANWANVWLTEHGNPAAFDPEYTYVFEIIYPENRIVVNYGEHEALVLLTIIETTTGIELPWEGVAAFTVEQGFQIPEYYGIPADLTSLPAYSGNAEGFVLRYLPSGLRVKVKYEEYVRLHRLITGVNEQRIWEIITRGESLDEFLINTPEEFQQLISSVVTKFNEQYLAIELYVEEHWRDYGDRKANAQYYQTLHYPHLFFAKLDRQPLFSPIWKLLKPAGLSASYNSVRADTADDADVPAID